MFADINETKTVVVSIGNLLLSIFFSFGLDRYIISILELGSYTPEKGIGKPLFERLPTNKYTVPEAHVAD